MRTTVVIGGNFAGMTAAVELKRKDPKNQRVILIDKSPLFLFIPSLIWVPFGRRDIKDISFRKDKILEKKGVEFVHAEAVKVLPEDNKVETTKGDFEYNDLVIATGPKVKYDVAKNFTIILSLKRLKLSRCLLVQLLQLRRIE